MFYWHSDSVDKPKFPVLQWNLNKTLFLFFQRVCESNVFKWCILWLNFIPYINLIIFNYKGYWFLFFICLKVHLKLVTLFCYRNQCILTIKRVADITTPTNNTMAISLWDVHLKNTHFPSNKNSWRSTDDPMKTILYIHPIQYCSLECSADSCYNIDEPDLHHDRWWGAVT